MGNNRTVTRELTAANAKLNIMLPDESATEFSIIAKNTLNFVFHTQSDIYTNTFQAEIKPGPNSVTSLSE